MKKIIFKCLFTLSFFLIGTSLYAFERASNSNSPYNSKHLAFFNKNEYSCTVEKYIAKTDQPILRFKTSFDYKQVLCNAKFSLSANNKTVLTITDFQKYDHNANEYFYEIDLKNHKKNYKLKEGTVYKGNLTVCDDLYKASIDIEYRK